MSLVEHARRELELSGQFAEDPAYAQSIMAAVAAFASYGHSGGSAMVAVEQLHALLRHEPLSPITGNPEEWIDRSEMSGTPMWQNRRDSRAMSQDGGETWWYVDGRHPGERCYDGGVLGVLARCPECGGGGLVHRPDETPAGPAPEPGEAATADRAQADLRRQLAGVLNSASAENRSNTPDFILADFLLRCLAAFDTCVNDRAFWYGRHDRPGQGAPAEQAEPLTDQVAYPEGVTAAEVIEDLTREADA